MTSLRDLFGGPAFAFVVGIFHNFEFQTGGMLEANEGVPKALLLAAVRHFVPVEMLDPERDGTLRHGVGGSLNLPGTFAARNALVRKRRHHRAGLGIRVCVVQVIVRVAAVKQDGLFDQALSDNLREKVNVFLGATGTNCDVVHARDRVIHRLASKDLIFQDTPGLWPDSARFDQIAIST